MLTIWSVTKRSKFSICIIAACLQLFRPPSSAHSLQCNAISRHRTTHGTLYIFILLFSSEKKKKRNNVIWKKSKKLIYFADYIDVFQNGLPVIKWHETSIVEDDTEKDYLKVVLIFFGRHSFLLFLFIP